MFALCWLLSFSVASIVAHKFVGRPNVIQLDADEVLHAANVNAHLVAMITDSETIFLLKSYENINKISLFFSPLNVLCAFRILCVDEIFFFSLKLKIIYSKGTLDMLFCI